MFAPRSPQDDRAAIQRLLMGLLLPEEAQPAQDERHNDHNRGHNAATQRFVHIRSTTKKKIK
jgi:hypothetical protein